MNTPNNPLKTLPKAGLNPGVKGQGTTQRGLRILAAWRGLDLTEEERLRRYRPKTTEHLTKQLIKGLKLDQRQAEAEIVKVWARTVDPRISAHAQPTGINQGTLFVTVDNSVWLHEIVRYHRRDILTRLQTAFGRQKIAKISFRLG